MGCTTGKSEISNTTVITSATKSRISLEPIQPSLQCLSEMKRSWNTHTHNHLASTAETDMFYVEESLYFVMLQTHGIF